MSDQSKSKPKPQISKTEMYMLGICIALAICCVCLVLSILIAYIIWINSEDDTKPSLDPSCEEGNEDAWTIKNDMCYAKPREWDENYELFVKDAATAYWVKCPSGFNLDNRLNSGNCVPKDRKAPCSSGGMKPIDGWEEGNPIYCVPNDKIGADQTDPSCPTNYKLMVNRCHYVNPNY